VSLNRILEGRPQLKYHEAGLDMGWSGDPYESFRIFQGKIREQYEQMVKTCKFTVIDATREIHEQQSEVRRIIGEKIDLAAYRRPTIK
jgi:dTMP kinase